MGLVALFWRHMHLLSSDSINAMSVSSVAGVAFSQRVKAGATDQALPYISYLIEHT